MFWIKARQDIRLKSAPYRALFWSRNAWHPGFLGAQKRINGTKMVDDRCLNDLVNQTFLLIIQSEHINRQSIRILLRWPSVRPPPLHENEECNETSPEQKLFDLPWFSAKARALRILEDIPEDIALCQPKSMKSALVELMRTWKRWGLRQMSLPGWTL